MIYNKESNFPYPILSQFSSDYVSGSFTFDVNLYDDNLDYKFVIDYSIDSHFINSLLKHNTASMYIVFESVDSLFFELKEKEIRIRKNLISLSKKTKIQLFIICNSGLNFSKNSELDKFYSNYKDKIYISKYNVLAMSNIVQFDGDLRKPFDLFLKQFDPNINTDMRFEIGSDMILIKYRDKNYQYNTFQGKNSLNNHYVYIGLQKALMQFYFDLSEDGNDIYIDEIEEPEDRSLYKKLYYLMKVKKINMLNTENIDDVIEQISDRILEKHYLAVKRVADNAS